MDRLHDCVGGLDVHRDTVVACVRHASGNRVTSHKERFGTTKGELLRCREWLFGYGVTLVVMEATGVYRKAPYYCFEGHFDQLWLVNAHHVQNVPGRKTDMNDAEWLADVAGHGMVRPSMVPEEPIRHLRELTRYRKTQVEARTREMQRMEKLLQDSGIKLTSFTSKTLTKSGRDMIEALIAGERDSHKLADLARKSMRSKIPQLRAALDGNFGPHHSVVARQILDHIDFLDASIDKLTEEIMDRLVPFENQVTLLRSIPGIHQRVAEIIVAETGADMSRWPTAGHFAAWAGVAPASYESAGKHKSKGTRHGARHLRTMLIEAAHAAARTDTFFGAEYRKLAKRIGANKAAVAVANAMATAIWHMLSTNTPYHDLGVDFYDKRRDSNKETKRLVSRLEAMGHKVVLKPAAA